MGISGKKQSGKTTLASYLLIALKGYAARSFSFADPLKQLVCKQVMGLTEDQVNGTDDDKNSLTKYSWDKLPDQLRERYSGKVETVVLSKGIDENGNKIEITEDVVIPRSGKMTAREIMQVVGTDFFRNHFSENIWVDATMRAIRESPCRIAVIPDVRFQSEVTGILENDGYIIRLQRQVSHDSHPSEIDLDDYDFDSLGDRCLVLGPDIDIPTMKKRGLDFAESKR